MYIHPIFQRYKLKIDGKTIYDPIRGKYVSNTPEEEVRQKTLKFIQQRLKVPANRIGVERTLHSLGVVGNWKRVDICIFDECDNIVAIIECKADDLGRWDNAYVQAIDYVELLGVNNYFVVDNWEFEGFHYCYERNQYDPIDVIPTYEEMVQMK